MVREGLKTMIDPDDVPEEELGIYRDSAMEERIACEDATQQLLEMYVTLDGIADSHDVPPALCSDVRNIQQEVRGLKARFKERAERVADIESTLNDRIAGLEGESDA